MKNTLLLFVCLVCAYWCIGAVRYVTVTGAGSMDGSTWSNAAPGSALQTMINQSSANDQVWVAAGTYFTTNTTNRSISISMKNGVAIYGGFAGTETALSQRNFLCGPNSILSGEIGVAGIGDNSYHVISNGTGLTNTAILDGFVIRDANDNRPATNNDGLGGGIYNNGSEGGQCSPIIRNCIITNNSAVFGAGIFNNGYNSGNASPIIINCIIANNTASTGGGGIDNFGLSGTASPTITNCIIYNNTAAQRAGGMYCWGGNNGNANPVVQNCVFAKNTAASGGGVVSDRLNASTGSSGNSNPVFTNCIFWGNAASISGNQFFILGGATFSATYSDVDLTGQTSPNVISGAATGNISSNPMFVNIDNAIGGDGCWLTNDDGLRLQTNSPCINTGTNTNVSATDLPGSIRIIGGTTDMGPYESESTQVVTGINDMDENYSGITLYPNPVYEEIHVDRAHPEVDADIYLLNTLGKIVYHGEASRQHEIINVSSLSQGVYITVIKQKDKVHTLKWIKK